MNPSGRKAGQQPRKPAAAASRFHGCLLLSLLLGGCASQGPLRPPSLNLPAPVHGLSAARVGDAVDLQWTNPGRTTDGLLLTRKHGPRLLQAEICRVEAPGSACVMAGHVPAVASGPGSWQDVLPARLLQGADRALEYRVRLLNGEGKGAAYAVVQAVAGPAPQPLAQVRAQPVDNGVLVQWLAAPESRTGAVADRILLRVRRGVEGTATQTAAAGNGDADAAKHTAEVLLALETAGQDQGGTVDTGARQGVEQQYSLTRTRTVQINGRDLTMSSTPTVVAVSAGAKRPPMPPPTGLDAVITTLGAPEVDLVWQPGKAAAYRVFRAEGEGTPVLLTAEPVRGLTYTDTAVQPGKQYRYSVASVDAFGVEGPRSAELVEQLPDR